MAELKIEELKRYFSRRDKLGVVSVYLFGSHALGRSHRESDIDLGVLLNHSRYPQRRDRFEMRIRLSSELIAELGQQAVDVVILNDVPPQLGRRIVHQGVRLYCGDPALDHAFQRDIQLRAADLDPFLRRMRKIKLEALAR